MTRTLGLAGSVIWIVLATGCVNEPGALRLELRPAKAAFAPDESIEIAATLVAGKGPLCLQRTEASACYRVEMQPTRDGLPLTQGRLAYCGTNPTMMLLPLAPLIWVAAALDVADIGGNYQLLAAGDHCKQSLSLTNSQSCVWTARTDDTRAVVRPGPHERWPVGRYRVRVQLEQQEPAWGPPIGWRLYDQAVIAAVEIEIVEDPGEQTAGTR